MAAISAEVGVQALQDILEAIAYQGGSIGNVRDYIVDKHNEELAYALLVTGNPTGTLWEIDDEATEVEWTSIGGHEQSSNHLFKIIGKKMTQHTTGNATAARLLFEYVHRSLRSWTQVRLGTGEAGIMIGPWQMTKSMGDVAKIGCRVCTITARLLNQPEETTSW